MTFRRRIFSTVLACALAILRPASGQISGPTPAGPSVPHVGIFCVNSAGVDVVCSFGTGGGGGASTQGLGSSADPWWFEGLGTAGAPAGGILTVQGVAGGQALPIAHAPVTPGAAANFVITSGGTAINLITGPVNGCYISNPLAASDQNIATAEVAYVNPVTTAAANGRGTNSALQPGQSWTCPPGMTTSVSGIAATSGHALNVVEW
jgi:hypothetical protein